MQTPLRNAQTAIFFTIMIWLFNGYQFGGGNHGAELPPIISIINPNTFALDFSVQDFLSPGPRYFYYNLVANLSLIFGLDVDVIYLVIKLFTHISFFYAVILILDDVLNEACNHYAINAPSSVLFKLCLFFFCSINLGSWGSAIFSTSVIPSTLAMSIAIWSVLFSLRKRWILAFSICGVATYVQALVGLFAGLTILPALLIFAVKSRQILTLAICSTLLLVPVFSIFTITVLSEASPTPTDFDFLRTFGEFRVPHHWFPSTGHYLFWVSDALFFFSGVISLGILFQNGTQNTRHIAILLSGIMLSALIGVFLNVLFVEFCPVEIIGKLQFQRIMPFGHFATALAILASVSILGWRELRVILMLLMSAPVILMHIVLSIASGSVLTLALIIILLSGLVLYYFSNNMMRWALIFSSATLLLFINTNAVNSIPHGDILSSRYQALYDTEKRGNPLYRWLHENTILDALILIPPDWSRVSDFLAFHSERAVYFSFKNVPYSDFGVFEWSNRAQVLLGRPILSDDVDISSLREIWESRPGSDVVDIMIEVQACYLVDRTDAREEIQLDMVYGPETINGEKWSVWKITDCSFS